MSKKVDLWMPLYVGDYLSATTRLTTEQHGAYLLLIMDYWKHGSLPNDDAVLAQITRMTPDAWSNARSILEAFFEVSDKHWKHARVEKELATASSNKQAASNRGKAGAAARWGNKNASSNASSNAQAVPEQWMANSTSPSPSPSPKKNKRSIDTAPDGVSKELWVEFNKICKAKSKPIGQRVLNKMISESEKAGLSLEKAIEVCCEKGWARFEADWPRDTSENLSAQDDMLLNWEKYT